MTRAVDMDRYWNRYSQDKRIQGGNIDLAWERREEEEPIQNRLRASQYESRKRFVQEAWGRP